MNYLMNVPVLGRVLAYCPAWVLALFVPAALAAIKAICQSHNVAKRLRRKLPFSKRR